LRARVEAICLRREIAFATRLPNGAQIRESAERILESYNTDDNWSDAALNELYLKGSIEALRHLAVPNWLVGTIVAVRALRLRIVRHMRESTGRK
jgi:hypothetical protein